MPAIIKLQPHSEQHAEAMSLLKRRAELVRAITAGRDAGKDMSEPQKTLNALDATLQFTMIDTQLIGQNRLWPANISHPVAFVHSRELAMLFRILFTVHERHGKMHYIFSAFPTTGPAKDDAVVHVVFARRPMPPQYKYKYRALEMILTIDKIVVAAAAAVGSGQAKDIVQPLTTAALVHVERIWQGPGSLRHIGELIDDATKRTYRDQLDWAYAEVGLSKLVFSHGEEKDEIVDVDDDDDNDMPFLFEDDIVD